MKLFKNYKKLYLNELENRKMLIKQNSDLSKQNVEYQKERNLYKERCARLTVDLEDVDYQLEKTTKERDALKKEKANLKRKNTIQKNALRGLGVERIKDAKTDKVWSIKKELNRDGE